MPLIKNRKSVWSYERNASVAAASIAVLNDFDFSGLSGPHELSLRLGISDIAAWGGGSFFIIEHNGRDMLTIDDQLADLLRPISIPVELTGKDHITVGFYNGSTAAVEASSVARVDAV